MIVMDVMISCRIVLFAIYNMDCGEICILNIVGIVSRLARKRKLYWRFLLVQRK